MVAVRLSVSDDHDRPGVAGKTKWAKPSICLMGRRRSGAGPRLGPECAGISRAGGSCGHSKNAGCRPGDPAERRARARTVMCGGPVSRRLARRIEYRPAELEPPARSTRRFRRSRCLRIASTGCHGLKGAAASRPPRAPWMSVSSRLTPGRHTDPSVDDTWAGMRILTSPMKSRTGLILP